MKTGIGLRLLEYSNKHETQYVCGVNRPISFTKSFTKLLFALYLHQIQLIIVLILVYTGGI